MQPMEQEPIGAIGVNSDSAQNPSMSAMAIFANYRLEPCLSRVLRFHRVQSRQSENRWRLDRPYCGGNCCDIPCLVDAATLCAVAPAAMLVNNQISRYTGCPSSECNRDVSPTTAGFAL